jgi:hypothetical protein
MIREVDADGKQSCNKFVAKKVKTIFFVQWANYEVQISSRYEKRELIFQHQAGLILSFKGKAIALAASNISMQK